jgi:hypothetical protein
MEQVRIIILFYGFSAWFFPENALAQIDCKFLIFKFIIKSCQNSNMGEAEIFGGIQTLCGYLLLVIQSFTSYGGAFG